MHSRRGGYGYFTTKCRASLSLSPGLPQSKEDKVTAWEAEKASARGEMDKWDQSNDYYLSSLLGSSKWPCPCASSFEPSEYATKVDREKVATLLYSYPYQYLYNMIMHLIRRWNLFLLLLNLGQLYGMLWPREGSRSDKVSVLSLSLKRPCIHPALPLELRWLDKPGKISWRIRNQHGAVLP